MSIVFSDTNQIQIARDIMMLVIWEYVGFHISNPTEQGYFCAEAETLREQLSLSIFGFCNCLILYVPNLSCKVPWCGVMYNIVWFNVLHDKVALIPMLILYVCKQIRESTWECRSSTLNHSETTAMLLIVEHPAELVQCNPKSLPKTSAWLGVKAR